MKCTELDSNKYKHQYYKTWASYSIPMKPVDPISYVETESLISFYLAYYTQGGQLVQFIKYLLEKKDIKEEKLSETRVPHSVTYFESIIANFSDAKLGKEISYSDTENYTFYYTGYVDVSGTVIKLQQVERKIFFCDNYNSPFAHFF